MEEHKLLDAFQAEFDKLRPTKSWPRKLTNSIAHIREFRVAGEKKAKEDLLQLHTDGIVRINEDSFPRSEPRQGDVKVTIVLPPEDHETSGRPCIIFCHGGGMAGSDRYVGLSENSKAWAETLGAITISVEYGRAPENFNDGLAKDCHEALLWAWSNPKLVFDRKRMILYGASAGATLATSTVLMLAQKKKKRLPNLPVLAGLFLEAPMLNWSCDSESMKRLIKNGPFCNMQFCRLAWDAIIKDKKNVSAFVSPGEADPEDIKSWFPPTAGYVGTMDPLHDEVVEFFAKAGRDDFVCKVVTGVPHGFDSMLPLEEVSIQIKAWRLAWMKEKLSV
ncbi:Esterase lipase thioesterase [Apiospora marii]|uniref:Esterase lipase thioesterase n=1 Tax=Apiospora marii TaxID=335849 RepID=A0ABR1S8G3_9PEZI